MKADVYSCALCGQITFKDAPESPDRAPVATIQCPACESVATWGATVALPEEQGGSDASRTT